MGNFLHKLFGYSDNESSCFRPKSNQIQPKAGTNQSKEAEQQKPKHNQADIERGINPSPGKNSGHKSSTGGSSYRSANANFDGYSSDEDNKHSTLFPKVSVKRSLQNSPPNGIKDDYNNNNNNLIPIPLFADSGRDSTTKVQQNSDSIPVVDDSSFHSIELNTHSISSQIAQNDETSVSHGKTSKSDSVHITREPESLPNIDLNREFVSPFTRGFTLPQHSMLEVPEKFRPRRSNIRMSTRILPTRTASDSRKNGAKPFVQKDHFRDSQESDDNDDHDGNDGNDKKDAQKSYEVNLEELPTEELRKVTKSRLSDMLKRQSLLMNGELSANRYRSVYEFTDNYGRYKIAEPNNNGDNDDRITEENCDNNYRQNGDNGDDDAVKNDRIQQLLNSNHQLSDEDACDDEMEPIPEHNDVTLRKPGNIPAHGHLQLMEELKKRQSTRIVYEAN